MMTNPIRPLGVGEVVVRVADLERSIAFYRDMLGFELIRVLHGSIAFMRVADGVQGHTQIVGLFTCEWPASREGKSWDGCEPRLSTLHHFAVEISLKDYDSVLHYLTERDFNPNTSIHAWSGGDQFTFLILTKIQSSSSATTSRRLRDGAYSALLLLIALL
jgi:catechol 2,3-dioxygenase-like lactoylglutathione lyase family enzyme